ncbi:MAG: hypothetical protein R3A52_18005 [Polyangiales bacterium]
MRQPIRTGPGPHVIEARERGGASVQRQVRVDGGGTMTITLDVTAQRTYVGSVPPEMNPPAPVAFTVTPPTPPAPVVVTPPTPPVVAPTPVPVVTPPPVAVAPAAPVNPPPLAVAPPTASPVLPPPGGDRPVTRSAGLPGAFWGGLAVTTAALGTAIGFFVYAESLASDFATIRRVYEGENDPARRQYYYELALSYSDAVEQNRTVAWVMTGVAAAGAAFTIASPFLFRSRSTSATRATLRVAPTFDRPECGAGRNVLGARRSASRERHPSSLAHSRRAAIRVAWRPSIVARVPEVRVAPQDATTLASHHAPTVRVA